VCIHVRACVCAHTHIHSHTYTHIHVYLCTHTYIYACVDAGQAKVSFGQPSSSQIAASEPRIPVPTSSPTPASIGNTFIVLGFCYNCERRMGDKHVCCGFRRSCACVPSAAQADEGPTVHRFPVSERPVLHPTLGGVRAHDTWEDGAPDTRFGVQHSIWRTFVGQCVSYKQQISLDRRPCRTKAFTFRQRGRCGEYSLWPQFSIYTYGF
jgi:hypothetical protein